MKRRISFPALAFFIFAALVASTQSSSAVVPDHGPTASGQGEFTVIVPGEFGIEHWTYSFDASANKNGQARGRAVFDIVQNSIQTQVVVKINCLEVVVSSGIASAFFSGTVLHSDDPEFPKRANVIFGAEDSSGAPTVLPDIITRAFVFEGVDCHDGLFPLTHALQPPDAIHIEP